MNRIVLHTIGVTVFAVVMLTAATAGAEKITAIEVEGNTKTTADTVILIADLRVGDEFALDQVSAVQAKLVNSGLFKNAEVSYTAFNGGLKIILKAEDKHSWVVAPTYYNQPTNQGGGIGFGENNLFGENKKLLVYGQVATGDSFFVGGYIDPSIKNTSFNWQADVYLLSKRTIEYAPPAEFRDDPQPVRESRLNYLNLGIRTGVKLGPVAFSGRLRGARVYYGDTKMVATDEPTMAPGLEGYDVSGEVRLEYDTRANWYGISNGNRYRLSGERSLVALGSEFDYWGATLSFERARKYFARHNLVIKGSAAYGRDLPFHAELSAGGTNLRGYKNEQLRGNLRLIGSLEYSVPTVEIKGVALRLLAFADSSYTAFYDTADNTAVRNYLPNHEVKGLAPFKNTVGLGTRLFVRQIVLPLLGLDVGYGIERNSWEVYLAIGLTDV